MTTDRRPITYVIDHQHSSVEFAVKHMMISSVRGRFLGLDGQIHIDEMEPTQSWVSVTIDTSSVDTGLAERDSHLRSPDFFYTARFPQIRFQSNQVERLGESRLKVTGDLTVRGITREVTLEAVLEGRMVGADRVERIGFSAETSLNRRDYGISWNGQMGRYLVGDEVKIVINIEGVKRSE